MPLPEFTLHDFNKIASGEYNAGQIDFVTSDNGRVSLAKINNHVHKTGLNKTTLSAARILEVKEAFVSALRRGGVLDADIAAIRARRGLPAAALDSARKRLDEAIAHAEKLAGEGKVVRNEDFSRKDVQKRLLQRELEAPSNPIKRVNGKSPFSSKSEIVKKAARQTRSLFFRDLFEHLEKKGWFR